MVYQLSLNLLGDHNEALDLSQEVFLRVFRTIHGFRGQSALRTWIYRIVVNQARNRQRWWRRRHRSQQVSLDDHIRDHGDCRNRPTALRRTGCSAGSSWRTGSATALDQLPFDQRTALVLREIDGLSYDEIGFSLGIAVGTVKSRLARARESSSGAIEGRMTLLTCAAVRRRLAAFHDRELPVGEMIAVESHIKECPPCARELRDLRSVGDELRAGRRAGARRRLDGAAARRDRPDARRSARVFDRAYSPALRGHAPGLDRAGVNGGDVLCGGDGPEHAPLRVAGADDSLAARDRSHGRPARARPRIRPGWRRHFSVPSVPQDGVVGATPGRDDVSGST